MEQNKTGKFIAEMRKEKSMTQRQLAELLRVSDKTISKWETGKGMPEVSLMLPLCEVLGINVNELLAGEKLTKENYHVKAEENIINISKEKERNKHMLGKRILLTFIIGCLFLVTLILILITGKPAQNDAMPIIPFDLNITAIGLGIVSWILAVKAIFPGKKAPKDRWKTYTCLSLGCCCISVWIPILIMDLLIRFRNGDVLDISWGYNFAAIALILGVFMFNACAWLVNRRK